MPDTHNFPCGHVSTLEDNLSVDASKVRLEAQSTAKEPSPGPGGTHPYELARTRNREKDRSGCALAPARERSSDTATLNPRPGSDGDHAARRPHPFHPHHIHVRRHNSDEVITLADTAATHHGVSPAHGCTAPFHGNLARAMKMLNPVQANVHRPPRRCKAGP